MRIDVWRILRKPEDTTLVEAINRAGYGDAYVANLTLHLWVSYIKLEDFMPDFSQPVTPAYPRPLDVTNILCKCINQHLWNDTVAIDLEPYTDGKLIVTQYPRQSVADVPFVRNGNGEGQK